MPDAPIITPAPEPSHVTGVPFDARFLTSAVSAASGLLRGYPAASAAVSAAVSAYTAILNSQFADTFPFSGARAATVLFGVGPTYFPYTLLVQTITHYLVRSILYS